MMYEVVYSHSGFTVRVEIKTDLEEAKSSVIRSVGLFNVGDDSVQIWDEKGNRVFSYLEDFLGIQV